MSVRRATDVDLTALAALRAQWHGRDADEAFVEELRAWSARADRLVWVASREGSVVGMVNLALFERMPSPDRPPALWGYLANLYVAQPHRGHGLGAALVAAVVDEARARGLVRVVLSPSEQSRSLYARAGFRSADELLVLPL